MCSLPLLALTVCQGPIADALVQKIAATGGILSHIDLERYKVKVTQALEGTYRGRKVYTTHAPTSGPGEDECIPFLPNCLTKFPVLLHMLNLIEKYDLKKRNGVNTHRFIEAMKFGFAARSVAPTAGSCDSSDIFLVLEYATPISKIIPTS